MNATATGKYAQYDIEAKKGIVCIPGGTKRKICDNDNDC